MESSSVRARYPILISFKWRYSLTLLLTVSYARSKGYIARKNYLAAMKHEVHSCIFPSLGSPLLNKSLQFYILTPTSFRHHKHLTDIQFLFISHPNKNPLLLRRYHTYSTNHTYTQVVCRLWAREV
ncbi:hypothetical protein Agabi119p4_11290 [Agaricus bisporus var. burnettii]|uniref:Uncharacterized protein n=1 Tax=Agaricus bisporus var. burnettii TaxID=192524 RepID=A0A8H7EW08_AGABI|nr:hypothetical protein Agabi119p4_11290 [Agaricus bisporus var. burnettii]